MKTLFCILAAFSACDATLFSLANILGAKDLFNVAAKSGVDSSYGRGGDTSQGYHHHGKAGHNYAARHYAFPKVIKVIIQHSPEVQGSGAGIGAYAHGYNYAAPLYGSVPPSPVVSQQLYALLPQILQLLFQQSRPVIVGTSTSTASLSPLHGRLIDTYGRSGKAVVIRSEDAKGEYFRSGHVVERGVLKVRRVKDDESASMPHSSLQHLKSVATW